MPRVAPSELGEPRNTEEVHFTSAKLSWLFEKYVFLKGPLPLTAQNPRI